MNDQLYMAPLLAFTDCTFREVYFRHFTGIDGALAPFIVVSENSRYRKKAVRNLLPILHDSIPIEPQVLSRDPYAFAALAVLLEDIGFSSVNINMGCPARAVVNKGRGSGLLPYPDIIREFLNISLPKIKIPVSVKLRTGLHSHDEIFPLIDVFNDFSLSQIIIHPRLGINKYEGPVNLDIMDDIVDRFKAPLVYNGDISRDSFDGLKTRFPSINRWMIGRELIKDPFLPGDIKSGVLSERTSVYGERKGKLRIFHDDLLKAFSQIIGNEVALVGKMKSYWNYLGSLFPDEKDELEKMKKILKLDDYRKCVDILLGNH